MSKAEGEGQEEEEEEEEEEEKEEEEEEEEEEKEEEEEEEVKEKPSEATAEGLQGEARDLPGSLKTVKQKAQREHPTKLPRELHPLQFRWVLWFFKNDRSRAWQDNLQLVTKFDTVEDFWATYRHVKLASKLSCGCDYALFKLLCLLGESFEEYSGEVCGAVVNIRTKGDKIALWTSEAENKAGVMHIGHIYKERLGLSTKTIIGYQAHADTAAKSNSLAKNKFVV